MDPVLQQPTTFMQQRSILIDSNALPGYGYLIGCSSPVGDCRLIIFTLTLIVCKEGFIFLQRDENLVVIKGEEAI